MFMLLYLVPVLIITNDISNNRNWIGGYKVSLWSLKGPVQHRILGRLTKCIRNMTPVAFGR